MSAQIIHYSDISACSSQHLYSSAILLFVQQHMWANIPQTSKLHTTYPLLGESEVPSGISPHRASKAVNSTFTRHYIIFGPNTLSILLRSSKARYWIKHNKEEPTFCRHYVLIKDTPKPNHYGGPMWHLFESFGENLPPDIESALYNSHFISYSITYVFFMMDCYNWTYQLIEMISVGVLTQ